MSQPIQLQTVLSNYRGIGADLRSRCVLALHDPDARYPHDAIPAAERSHVRTVRDLGDLASLPSDSCSYVIFVPAGAYLFTWTQIDQLDLTLDRALRLHLSHGKEASAFPLQQSASWDGDSHSRPQLLIVNRSAADRISSVPFFRAPLASLLSARCSPSVYESDYVVGHLAAPPTMGRQRAPLAGAHRVMLVLYHQFERNVFEKYAYHLYRKLMPHQTSVYLVAPPNSALSYPFDPSDVIVDTAERLVWHLSELRVTRVVILYLPYLRCPEAARESLVRHCRQQRLPLYVYIGGTVSHMHRYAIDYPDVVKKVLTMGSWLRGMYRQTRLPTEVYPTYWYPELQVRSSYAPLARLRKTFACIGRLGPEKRSLFVLETFKSFLDEIGDRDYRLYVIGGSTPPQLAAYRQAVTDLGLEQQVVMIDWLDTQRLHELIADRIDYNIVASVTEGLCGVLLETMAMGVPSIVSRVHCVDEVTTHLQNAVVFSYEGYQVIERGLHLSPVELEESVRKHDAQNRESLLEAFRRVHGDLALRNRLGQRCVEYMNQTYQAMNDLDVKSFLDLQEPS